MEDNRKGFAMIWLGVLIGLWVGLNFNDKEQPEYSVIEDNAVETIISIKQGDDLTLLNINRYEDGGGLWEVTYDGKNEPETKKVQNAKE